MDIWGTIYNFFALLLLSFMMLVLYSDVNENERQFEELHLKYAIDYATEGAFTSALEGGDLGISYLDLQNVRVVPENTLGIFKTIILLSYDMSLSEANYRGLDTYISSAVLAVADGYYIATPKKDSNATAETNFYTDSTLSWGIKKPYIIEYKDEKTAVAYNLSNENWVAAKDMGSTILMGSAYNFLTPDLNGMYLDDYITQVPTREEITTAINKRIMDDINFNIKERNRYIEKILNDDGSVKTDASGNPVLYETYNRRGVDDFIYLPTVQTATGINPITKPSMFVTMAGIDFAGRETLDAQSVGGYTVADKRRILGFIENGQKYYCYEGQLEDLSKVQNFYNSVDEAAKAGYNPHVAYLSRVVDKD